MQYANYDELERGGPKYKQVSMVCSNKGAFRSLLGGAHAATRQPQGS